MNHNPKLDTLKVLAKKSLLMAGLAIMSSGAVYALPSDRQQPISLVADRATFNEKTGVTTYSGNVIIEQGTMRLQAASIVANLNAKKQISTITATGGPAKFQQQVDPAKGLAKGQASKIVYNAETGIITMTGNALLEQDGSSIRGGSLKYSMNKGDIEAIGTPNNTGSSNGRVQIVIPATNSKSFPGARD
jgi:lipopolysaccharide export system protein LptA